MNPQLEKRLAIDTQVRPVGVKILFDQLEGKDVVTRGNGGVGGEDSGVDIVFTCRRKIAACSTPLP